MSQETDKYKGKLPKPAKNQSISEFEDEEIKPDDEYTEFKSVKEILQRPDYFSPIIDQPEFQELLSRSQDYLKSLQEEGIDVSKFIKDDEKKEDKPKEPVQSTEESEEPKGAIDVAMEPVVIEEIETEEKPKDQEKSTKFEPQIKRTIHNVSAPISLMNTSGIITLEKNGLEDILMPSKAQRKTSDGRKLFDFRQRYRGAATIAALPFSGGNGELSATTHSYVLDESLSGHASKTHKFDVETTQPNIKMANSAIRDQLSVNVGLAETMVRPEDDIFPEDDGMDTRDAIDLAYDPRDRGLAQNALLKCADVMVNPFRMPLLLHDQTVHKAMTLDFEEFLNEHAEMINRKYLTLIRKNNAMDRDVITQNKYEVTRYNRLMTTQPNSNSYYYTDAVAGIPYLSRGILNKSFDTAMDAMSTLTPSTRSITSNITNRQASSMLMNLSSVLPSEASTLMTRLSAFLLGGMRRSLSIEVDEASSKSQLITSLASMANLLLIDMRFVDEKSKVQLLTNVLSPFYNEFEMDTLVRGQGRDAGLRQERTESAMDIALAIVNRRDYRIPRVAKFSDPTGRGSVRIQQIRVMLQFLIDNAMGLEYNAIDNNNRLFKTPIGNTFIPVIARGDIFNIVMYGERMDANESFRHDVSSYRPEANQIANYMMQYAEILSLKMEFRGADMAMTEALANVTHIAKGHAIVADAFIRATAHTEMLPALGRMDRDFIDTVDLPFTGALSYIMYGVGSSRVSDSNDMYLQFTEMSAPPLPSLFPLYIFFERAIATEVYREFESTLIITKRDEVIELVIEILSSYFTSIDPETRGRVEYMFDAGGVVFRDRARDVTLPAEYKTELYFDDMRPSPPINMVQRKGGLNQLPAEHNILKPYQQSIDCVDKTVREVYLKFDPIEPEPMRAFNDEQMLIYTESSGQGVYLDLDDILLIQDYIESDTLTLEKIKQYTRVYCDKLQIPFGNFSGVKVKSLHTTFKFVEHVGKTDILTETPTVEIMRNVEYKENKYKISEIPVYFHKLTNYFGFGGEGGNREVDYLRSFMTFAFIERSVIDSYLIALDNVDIMNPLLYKTKMINNVKTKIDDQSLAKLRIRDGKGITYTGNMTLATREEEKFSIVSEIKSRF